MTSRTVYIADDKSQWDDPADAMARDELIKRLAAIMAPLGRDGGPSFHLILSAGNNSNSPISFFGAAGDSP